MNLHGCLGLNGAFRAAWILGLAGLCPVLAAPERVVHPTLAGGGGTMVGGRFSVTSTLGEPVTGISGALPAFGLVSGFWGALMPELSPPVTPAFEGLPVAESGTLRLRIRGDGRIRVERSIDLQVWTTAVVLAVPAGKAVVWEEPLLEDFSQVYRLVAE